MIRQIVDQECAQDEVLMTTYPIVGDQYWMYVAGVGCLLVYAGLCGYYQAS